MSQSTKSKTVKFTTAVDNIEEQYIRSGGKDPYVLSLLTRAYSDGKKTQDGWRKKGLEKTYENLKQTLIRQYNDVELENVKLQYELLSIQHQLKAQLPVKGDKRPGTSPMVNQPQVLVQQVKSPGPRSPPKPSQTMQPQPHLQLVQNPMSFPFLPNFSGIMQPPMVPGIPGMQPNFRNPYGNTYIVTGDEVYINGLDVTDGKAKSPNPMKMPRSTTPSSLDSQRVHRAKHIRKQSVPKMYNMSTPTIGLDADLDSVDENVDYNGQPFFEVNRTVPQGQYDFNSGILIFFDFVTKLPKEARFCKLSVALITAGKMKPPISFTSLPTEQYSPGDHPEFKHFTTTCRFAYNLSIAGGKPNGGSSKSGVSLIVEILISPDKPIDDHAPVLGWVRHGWVPISCTRKTFDDDPHLTTYAGRYRTMLRKTLPLTRDSDGLLDFVDESSQQLVDHRSELFYRIVNTQQSSVERLAPVDVKNMEYYDIF